MTKTRGSSEATIALRAAAAKWSNLTSDKGPSLRNGLSDRPQITYGSASIRSGTTYYTASTDVRSYITAASHLTSLPGQRKRSTNPKFSKLRDLFEANGIQTKQGPKPQSKRGTSSKTNDHDESLKELFDKDLVIDEDKDHEWCGFQEENDWCGLGMHVDLRKGDQVQLEPLEEVVGHGTTATIDVVRCRGIRLARKTIYLRRGLQLHDVLKEVRALHELRHSHIIRLVGTYSQSKSFSMLLYPVADQNLAEYLYDATRMERSEIDTDSPRPRFTDRSWLSQGSVCLASALRYIHKQGIKHMDIKPQNILLKDIIGFDPFNPQILETKMFLCDFGIAHIFDSQEASKTDWFLGRTPKYASPEVASGEVHGRAADIFSLGCVLLEINTVFSNWSLSDFSGYRIDGLRPKAYNETVPRCQTWLERLDDMDIPKSTIALMIEEDPCRRPKLFAGSNSHLPTKHKQDVSTSPDESKDAAPSSSEAIVNIISQCCAHDSDGPEPYVYEGDILTCVDEVPDRSEWPQLNSLEPESEKANDDIHLT